MFILIDVIFNPQLLWNEIIVALLNKLLYLSSSSLLAFSWKAQEYFSYKWHNVVCFMMEEYVFHIYRLIFPPG